MNRSGSTITAALTALAALQFSLLAGRLGTGSAGHVAMGDDLSGVQVRDSGGRSHPLGKYQLVLAFDPECAHSRQVALQWGRFLRDPGRPAGVLAVAPGPLEAAAGHAEAHGWRVPVATMDRFGLGSREHALVSRTPWVFALRDGRVVALGHGDELADVVAALPPAAVPPATDVLLAADAPPAADTPPAARPRVTTEDRP